MPQDIALAAPFGPETEFKLRRRHFVVAGCFFLGTATNWVSPGRPWRAAARNLCSSFPNPLSMRLAMPCGGCGCRFKRSSGLPSLRDEPAAASQMPG